MPDLWQKSVKNATLISEEYVAEGIKVEAILDEKLYSKAEKYIVD